jgi:hypothetical protein
MPNTIGDRPQHPLKRILQRACIWFGPTLVFCVVAELAARSFYAERTYDLKGDSFLNHKWIPNHTMSNPHFAERGVAPYTRNINSQSWLATRDFDLQKPEGVYRVAYVGDSFIEGTCAEVDAIPSIVERTLTVPGKRVEVMNTGTSSYSPLLHFLLLKTKLLAFKPDLVVIAVDMTDVFDDSVYRATLQVDENGDPVACPPGHPAVQTHRRTEEGLQKITVSERVMMKLYDRSAAVRLVVEVGETWRRSKKLSVDTAVPRSLDWCAAPRSEETKRNVAFTMEMLRKTVQLAKSAGAAVVVTGMPHLGQMKGAWSLQPLRDIETVCRHEGVPFLDPVPEMQRMLDGADPQDIYITGDIHYNTKGYRMVGEIHAKFLQNLRPS